MLDIRTRIRTDLNPSKRIRFRIRSKNIRTVFIPAHTSCCSMAHECCGRSIMMVDSPACLFSSTTLPRDENGSDTDGYHRYYICFHISVWIRIRIRIVSTMSDRIRLDIDIINMRFEYSDTDTVSDVEYSNTNTDTSTPL